MLFVLSQIPDLPPGWDKLTLVGALVILIYLMLTGKIVPGRYYDELKRENERLAAEVKTLETLGKQAAKATETMTEMDTKG